MVWADVPVYYPIPQHWQNQLDNRGIRKCKYSTTDWTTRYLQGGHYPCKKKKHRNQTSRLNFKNFSLNWKTVESLNPTLCELLARDFKGNIKQTNENCQLVLQRDERLTDAIRFNEFTGQIDVVKEIKSQKRRNKRRRYWCWRNGFYRWWNCEIPWRA